MDEGAPKKQAIDSQQEESTSLSVEAARKLQETIEKLDNVAKSLGYHPVPTFQAAGFSRDEVNDFFNPVFLEENHYSRFYYGSKKNEGNARIIALAQIDGTYFTELVSDSTRIQKKDLSIAQMEAQMKELINS